ncbi:MAG: adenosine-specific kinase [Thermodesulfobacteriota bacterium]
MELKTVRLEVPEDANIIIGTAHFIKAIEDIYEAVATSVPDARFGAAFCEASGPCLVRVEGTDEGLKRCASGNAAAIGAGHCFVVVMKGAFPIHCLNALKSCAEVCTIYCATANAVELIVAETAGGRAVLGVVDGASPKGVETEEDVRERKGFLRKIGYKL